MSIDTAAVFTSDLAKSECNFGQFASHFCLPSPSQWFSSVRNPRRRSWTLRAKWSTESAAWSAPPSTSTPCWEVPRSHTALCWPGITSKAWPRKQSLRNWRDVHSADFWWPTSSLNKKNHFQSDVFQWGLEGATKQELCQGWTEPCRRWHRCYWSYLMVEKDAENISAPNRTTVVTTAFMRWT